MHEQVDKVFGPGNQYVTAAKMLLQVRPIYSSGMMSYYRAGIEPALLMILQFLSSMQLNVSCSMDIYIFGVVYSRYIVGGEILTYRCLHTRIAKQWYLSICPLALQKCW